VGRGHCGEFGHQVSGRARNHDRRRDCGCGQVRLAGSGRFKEFSDPDPSYHGLSYTEAFGPLAFILKARVQGLRDTGASLSPFNAFLLLQGIETLHLRLERTQRMRWPWRATWSVTLEWSG